jgi:hypothetical protein
MKECIHEIQHTNLSAATSQRDDSLVYDDFLTLRMHDITTTNGASESES